MRQVILTTMCRKDLKRLQRSGHYDQVIFQEIVTLLADDQPLPTRYRDHILRHNWTGHRECHLKPDWLLIYRLEREKLILVRTGSHAELFG